MVCRPGDVKGGYMGQEGLQASMDAFLPLRDVVFNTLRQGILTGELVPGERLMEIHLAKRLGVSRTPIREAIRKLELEGLVIMVPRKGACVAQISQKSMKDVLEVRKALDVLAMELACERICPEELEQLNLACEAFALAVKGGDLKKIAQKDVELHEIIFRATGNSRLLHLIHSLSEQMYRYRFEYIKNTSQHRLLVEEHRVIYESLVGRQKDKAMEAAALHIDNQAKAIVEQIEREAMSKGERAQGEKF